jgi:hypothetical protein
LILPESKRVYHDWEDLTSEYYLKAIDAAQNEHRQNMRRIRQLTVDPIANISMLDTVILSTQRDQAMNTGATTLIRSLRNGVNNGPMSFAYPGNFVDSRYGK